MLFVTAAGWIFLSRLVAGRQVFMPSAEMSWLAVLAGFVLAGQAGGIYLVRIDRWDRGVPFDRVLRRCHFGRWSRL